MADASLDPDLEEYIRQQFEKYMAKKITATRFAKNVGVDPGLVIQKQPVNVDIFVEEYSQSVYLDMSAGAVAGEMPLCLPRTMSLTATNNTKGKYNLTPNREYIENGICFKCQAVMEKGTSPEHILWEWNGKSPKGPSIKFASEALAHLHLNHGSTTMFETALAVMEDLHKENLQAMVTARVEDSADRVQRLHAMVAVSVSHGKIKCDDSRPTWQGNIQMVGESEFYELVLIDPVLTAHHQYLDLIDSPHPDAVLALKNAISSIEHTAWMEHIPATTREVWIPSQLSAGCPELQRKKKLIQMRNANMWHIRGLEISKEAGEQGLLLKTQYDALVADVEPGRPGSHSCPVEKVHATFMAYKQDLQSQLVQIRKDFAQKCEEQTRALNEADQVSEEEYQQALKFLEQ